MTDLRTTLTSGTSAEDLAACVRYLLWEEAKRLLEFDAQRYTLDVVDGGVYQRLTAEREARRQAIFDRLEYRFEERAARIRQDAKAVLTAAAEELRAELLPLARLRVRSMGKDVDQATRRSLRELLVRHGRSDDALLFAYLTMQDLIVNAWAHEGTAPTSEDRFADEVAESFGTYDGACDLKALLRVPKRHQVRDGWRVVASFDTAEEAVAEAQFRNIAERCPALEPRYVAVDAEAVTPKRRRAAAAA